MQVENYPELLDLVKSLKSYITASRDKSILLRRETEQDPLSIDLSFSPAISEKTVEAFLREDVCTLCDKRVGYKPDQFTIQKPRLPYLVLIHNSFKLSPAQYYENPSEDEIFRNMIKGGLECQPQDLLVREILRCYFGQKDEKNPAYIQNCLGHLKSDIERNQIQGLLIVGQAASLLFNSDNQFIMKNTGKVIRYENVPALITPGPNRIHYMNQNRFDPAAIRQEKLGILQNLKRFKSEIMKI